MLDWNNWVKAASIRGKFSSDSWFFATVSFSEEHGLAQQCLYVQESTLSFSKAATQTSEKGNKSLFFFLLIWTKSQWTTSIGL